MPDGSPHLDPKNQSGVAPPFGIVGQGMRTLIRQFFALVGLLMIVIAIPIAFVTPILPIGLPIAIIGVVLLGRNSIWGRNWMERVLARHPRMERFAPNWLMKAVFGRAKRSDI